MVFIIRFHQFIGSADDRGFEAIGGALPPLASDLLMSSNNDVTRWPRGHVTDDGSLDVCLWLHVFATRLLVRRFDLVGITLRVTGGETAERKRRSFRRPCPSGCSALNLLSVGEPNDILTDRPEVGIAPRCHLNVAQWDAACPSAFTYVYEDSVVWVLILNCQRLHCMAEAERPV